MSSESFELKMLDNCPFLKDERLIFNLGTRTHNGSHQEISGNLSFPFAITDAIRITIQGLRERKGRWIEDKTYVNERSLCRIMDNYVWDSSENDASSDLQSVCPIQPGTYEIADFSPNFQQILFPREMLGSVKFRVQLLDENNELIMCKDFQIFNVEDGQI